MKQALTDFKYGLHSNIPLCCVLQWTVDHYISVPLLRVRSVARLPWRRPFYTGLSFGPYPLPANDFTAQYWPCLVHQILHTLKLVKPRYIYNCKLDGTGRSMPCPKCRKYDV